MIAMAKEKPKNEAKADARSGRKSAPVQIDKELARMAAVLGHKSTAMIHKSYSHVGEQSRVLKEAVERMGKAG